MKEVVILSGKGGTGKTSIVGSFAAIAKNKMMAKKIHFVLWERFFPITMIMRSFFVL